MITVEEAKRKMRGVTIPLATIFKDDLSLDLEATKANIQWIVDQGAGPGNTIFIACGSGGDFTVMNTDERKAVIKATADIATKAKIPSFASVQSTDIRTTIELCKHCEDVGIDIVQMSSAYYYDVKQGDLIAWYEECAKHTKVGFAAYSHHYSGSKYDMTMDVAERLLQVPNTVAVKWGSPNIANYLAGFKLFVPRVAVVNNGPLSIYGHQMGVKAWVSHVPNFFPQHSWRVHSLMEKGKYQEAQAVFDDFMDPYSKIRGAIGAQTAGEGVFVRPFMAEVGLKAGRSRLPSRDEVVTPQIRADVKKLLASAKSAVGK
ncbi:MAG: dihydrodipicolinate synthase family protein [SAR202 cluster bacterium]|nr:dihydrodipicolinate synthase family protein [SAR202 cluster bacterium]